MARDTMAHVSKAKKTLILLANSKPAAAKKIIAKASQNVLKAISELALNMLNGVLTLNDAQKKRMKRHKNSMRRLAEVNSTLSAKKKDNSKGRVFVDSFKCWIAFDYKRCHLFGGHQ